jgi:hypothetical protein
MEKPNDLDFTATRHVAVFRISNTAKLATVRY